MRYVQIGILISLVAIVGLLGAIYLGERPAAPEVAAELESPAPSMPVPAEPAMIAEGAALAEREPIAEPVRKPKPVGKANRSEAPFRPTPAKAPEPVAQTQPKPRPGPSVVERIEFPPRVEAPPNSQKELAGVAARVAPKPPLPPPEPRRVTLLAGTDLVVRLDFGLSSDRNFSGDNFTASLDQAIVIDDMVIAEKGARVEGKVVEAVRAGRVKGLAKLSLELTSLDTADGQTISLVSNRLHQEGPSSTGSDVKKVGIGAGVGALIGAIAGGGKGAAIGAGVGAGAGGGAAAATRGKPVEIPTESQLEFRLMEALEVVERL